VALVALLAAPLAAAALAAQAEHCTLATTECSFVSSLLERREGYGRVATGGLGGNVVIVRSFAVLGPSCQREKRIDGRHTVVDKFS